MTDNETSSYLDRAALALHEQMPGCAHDEHGSDCRSLAAAVLPVFEADTLGPGEHRTVFMHEDERTLKIKLPRGIGYVEIRTGNVHGPTGFPVVGVDVVSKATRIPAADGLLYTTYRDRESGVVLVGEPGPKMLEQQRQVAWFEKVIKLHDSGDHSECPDTCPAKEN